MQAPLLFVSILLEAGVTLQKGHFFFLAFIGKAATVDLSTSLHIPNVRHKFTLSVKGTGGVYEERHWPDKSTDFK